MRPFYHGIGVLVGDRPAWYWAIVADTLVHRIEAWAASEPDRPAVHSRRASSGGDTWVSYSWGEHWQAITGAARGLLELGLTPGQCVAIVGANCPEWVQIQFAVQAAGGILAPIYPTSTAAQLGHVVGNCQAQILVCDGPEQLEKCLSAEASGDCPRLQTLIVLDSAPHEDPRVLRFEELVQRGAAQPMTALQERLDALAADQTCLLIYTSGTTGVSKGVMLDHAGQLATIEAVLERFPQFRDEVPYRVVSYLPLSHQTEQMLTNVGAILVGGEVYFCPAIDQVRDYLVAARPTAFVGVPRVWEKFELALRGRLSETRGASQRLARWALATELAAFDDELADRRPRRPLGRKLARALVIDKIKERLGLDRLVAAFTGSAPIGENTQRFFASLGIVLHEGYGLSETSGLATINPFGRPRLGTVGTALRCTEIRIADDAEVQLRGANVTRGYMRQPQETAELFTDDGWLCTGDLGYLDHEGYLRITGRKKELLITAGGKNVAPVEMENLIRAIDGVGQVVVVGDRKPYLSALITLDPETQGELCRRAGVPERAPQALAADRRLIAFLQAEVERECNSKVARYQTIKKIAIIPHELSVEGGELTPTMKLRRSAIADKYAERIAALYAVDREAGPAAGGQPSPRVPGP